MSRILDKPVQNYAESELFIIEFCFFFETSLLNQFVTVAA